MQAHIRGVGTHGSNRTSLYIERIRQNVLDPASSPQLEQTTPVVALVNSQNAFGFVAAQLGAQRAIEMASDFGIGMVSVKFGMSAWMVQQAIDAGMLPLVSTNPPLRFLYGVVGLSLWASSPSACGAPAGKERLFILGMTPSIDARGKVYRALRRGERILEDWALDAEGRRTADQAKALQGVMLPMGGPKGSALSIMVDVFAGCSLVLYLRVMSPTHTIHPSLQTSAISSLQSKPNMFISVGEFKDWMDYLYHRVVGCDKMEGVDRIYYPGEIEQITRDKRPAEGILFTESEIASLNREAELVGVERLNHD